jgi:hypothetical protein
VTRQRRTRFTRDLSLRLLGAAGFCYLLLSSGTERPTYMLACLALMGVPSVLRRDEKRKDEDR